MLLSVSYEEVLDININTLFTMMLDSLKEAGKLDKIKQGSIIISNGVESKVIQYINNEVVILEMNYNNDLYQQRYYYQEVDEKTLFKYEEYYFSKSTFRTLNFKLYRFISRKSKLKRVKQMFASLK